MSCWSRLFVRLPRLHFLAKSESLWLDCLSSLRWHLGQKVESPTHLLQAIGRSIASQSEEVGSQGEQKWMYQLWTFARSAPVSLSCVWESLYTEGQGTHLGRGGGGWGSWLCVLAR